MWTFNSYYSEKTNYYNSLRLRERDEFAELWMWNMLVFEYYTCELGK